MQFWGILDDLLSSAWFFCCCAILLLYSFSSMSRDENYPTSLYPMCRELGSKPGAWEVLNGKDGKKVRPRLSHGKVKNSMRNVTCKEAFA